MLWSGIRSIEKNKSNIPQISHLLNNVTDPTKIANILNQYFFL